MEEAVSNGVTFEAVGPTRTAIPLACVTWGAGMTQLDFCDLYDQMTGFSLTPEGFVSGSADLLVGGN